MRFRHVLIGAAMLLSTLSGCKNADSNHQLMNLPGTETAQSLPTLTSLHGGNFYRNGFPTDLRRDAAGKIQIHDFPRQIHWLTDRYVDSIPATVDGYHTVMPVYLPFAAAIDLDALPSRDADYIDPQSPVQLIDIDPDSAEYGRRFPLQLSMTRIADSYRPRHLLQAYPTLGVNLRPNTTYALIVSDQAPLRVAGGWEQHPQLAAVLMPQPSELDLAASVQAVYAPLRQYLAQQAIDPHTIVGATVWTTGDPLARFHRAAAQVAAQAEQLAQLPVRDLEQFDDYPEYCVIRGFIDVPGYQKGVPPY